MERTLASELGSKVGERVRMAGWLHHQRQLANVALVLLRDRSGIAQIVVVDAGDRDAVAGLHPQTVIELEGTAVQSDQAPAGVEVVDANISVINQPTTPPPFELRRPQLNAQLPTLLDHAAVSLRHPARRAIAKVAAASVSGFRSGLDGMGFTEVFTPKVVAAATESGANVFPIDWFGEGSAAGSATSSRPDRPNLIDACPTPCVIQTDPIGALETSAPSVAGRYHRGAGPLGLVDDVTGTRLGQKYWVLTSR